ncbi:hypothetical protein, partial [Pseudobowmanella zhangzhouensis]
WRAAEGQGAGDGGALVPDCAGKKINENGRLGSKRPLFPDWDSLAVCCGIMSAFFTVAWFRKNAPIS